MFIWMTMEVLFMLHGDRMRPSMMAAPSSPSSSPIYVLWSGVVLLTIKRDHFYFWTTLEDEVEG